MITKFNNYTIMNIFQFFLLITLVLGFYMLFNSVKNKDYRNISVWRFPMLLAILLETFSN